MCNYKNQKCLNTEKTFITTSATKSDLTFTGMNLFLVSIFSLLD